MSYNEAFFHCIIRVVFIGYGQIGVNIIFTQLVDLFIRFVPEERQHAVENTILEALILTREYPLQRFCFPP